MEIDKKITGPDKKPSQDGKSDEWLQSSRTQTRTVGHVAFAVGVQKPK